MGSARRVGEALLVVAVQAAVLVPPAVYRFVDGDEGVYPYASRLAVHGSLPYRDFFYEQAPLLPYVYGPIGWLTGEPWYALRGLSVVLAIAVGLLLYLFVRDRHGLAAAWAAVAVYAGSGLVFGYLTLVKTFALSTLLVFGAYVLAEDVRWLGAGVLVGLAVDTRLLLLAVVPVFLLYARRRPAFAAGLGAALVPTLVFLVISPSAFWFDNVRYHSLKSSSGLVGDAHQRPDGGDAARARVERPCAGDPVRAARPRRGDRCRVATASAACAGDRGCAGDRELPAHAVLRAVLLAARAVPRRRRARASTRAAGARSLRRGFPRPGCLDREPSRLVRPGAPPEPRVGSRRLGARRLGCETRRARAQLLARLPDRDARLGAPGLHEPVRAGCGGEDLACGSPPLPRRVGSAARAEDPQPRRSRGGLPKLGHPRRPSRAGTRPCVPAATDSSAACERRRSIRVDSGPLPSVRDAVLVRRPALQRGEETLPSSRGASRACWRGWTARPSDPRGRRSVDGTPRVRTSSTAATSASRS